jgi:hypothetical protein
MLRRRIVRGARIHDQAEQIWLILTAFVMFSTKQTITYGDLAKKMGYETRNAGHTLGRPLGLVGKMCIESGAPPLNVIVVTKHGQPGDEVLLRPHSTVEADQDAVHAENWFAWRAPTAGSFRRISAAS